MDPVTRVRRYDGLSPYEQKLESMQVFTRSRDLDTSDELWVVEHAPVFTLGQAGLESHILNAADVPVVQSDRGGQVTYHGPGQLVVYTLVDLRRGSRGVKKLVSGIEQAVIDLLENHGLSACRRRGAPGVYVDEAKISALGLRVHRGCSYHGLALNVAMDLEPFARINPCGYAGLAVTDLASLGIGLSLAQASSELLDLLVAGLALAPLECAQP
jgi:lipoyl(octanoyl) transferase